MGRVTTPSFGYLIAAANRRKDYPAVAVLNKTTCRRLLMAYGAPVTRGHSVIGSLESLTPDLIAEACVVKPVQGSSSRGVCALVPDEPGTWVNILTDNALSFRELIDTLSETMVRHRLGNNWIVEELLLPPDGRYQPVKDVKAYAFRGEVPLVLVRASKPKRFRWFTDEWEPIDVGKYDGMIDDTLRPPEDAASFLRVARDLSVRLPIPFMRIDFYDTSRGPVVGELTPLPGGFDEFNDEWDERLGVLYEEAESSLRIEGMAWKKLFPRRQAWQAVKHRAVKLRHQQRD